MAARKTSRAQTARKRKPATPSRDVERTYTTRQTIEKLRRLADALEQGKAFRIQVAGERIYIPADTAFNIAHERDDEHEEVEFQFTWKPEG